jgi:hypothetical protein
MTDEEKKHEKLISNLKNLPKVNAPQNFESNLWRKINLSKKSKQESFWDKLLSPGKLIPAGVAVVAAIIIFFVIDIKSNQPEDPFSLQPRMREDIVTVEKFEEKSSASLKKLVKKKDAKKELELNKLEGQLKSKDSDNELMLSKESSGFRDEVIAEDSKQDSLKTQQQSATMGRTISPTIEAAAVPELKKDNLNFMQINLSAKEKQEVERLKQQVRAPEKAKSE